MWRNIIVIALSLICVAVFILSAVTKLISVEPFEISLVDIGVAGWEAAPAAARLFIGTELVIGFLFLLLFSLRKLTVPLAFLLTLVFTVYLFLVLSIYGNKGDCGCFGDTIHLSPLQGITKNLFLLLFMIVIYKWAQPFEFRFKWVIAVAGVIVCLALPFILNPIGVPFAKKSFQNYKPFPLATDLLTKSATDTAMSSYVIYNRKVVGFFSAKCPHCRTAAKKLVVMRKRNPALPIVFVMYNNTEKLQEFLDDTRSQNVPILLLNSKEDFLAVVENRFPRIYFLENGVVKYETNFYQLDQKDVEDWLKTDGAVSTAEGR